MVLISQYSPLMTESLKHEKNYQIDLQTHFYLYFHQTDSIVDSLWIDWAFYDIYIESREKSINYESQYNQHNRVLLLRQFVLLDLGKETVASLHDSSIEVDYTGDNSIQWCLKAVVWVSQYLFDWPMNKRGRDMEYIEIGCITEDI